MVLAQDFQDFGGRLLVGLTFGDIPNDDINICICIFIYLPEQDIMNHVPEESKGSCESKRHVQCWKIGLPGIQMPVCPCFPLKDCQMHYQC